MRAIVVALVLVVAGAALATRLDVSASTGSLVGGGNESGQATEKARERFGDDAVYVLVRGDLPRMVLTSDLNRLLGLEGCLSGNLPAGATPPGGAGSPCDKIAAADRVHVVYGPGTFINSSVNELTAQLQGRTRERAAQADRAREAASKLARADGKSAAEARRLGQEAEKLVYAQFASELLAMNAKYGLNLTGAPKLNDPDFVYQLVFDPSRGERTPKARFAYLFPSPESALISVRLNAGLSEEERAEAVALVRDAVAMPEWKLESGGNYVVTGVPVLADELTGVLAGSTLRLLLVGVAVMALVLALLFRARLRLLPLMVALGTVSIVFGALALLGLPLTMASIAVLPVLLGLAVDYAIQFQAGNSRRVISTAALATAVGFLILLLSPVPMVRGFGALLVVGVGVALALTFTAGAAVLRRPPARGGFARALRGAGELVNVVRLPRLRVERPLRWVVANARAVLVAAVLLAVGGWVLDSRIAIESELQKLVPQSLAAVQDLDALQRSTGTAGEIDVLVEGEDLTDPAVVRWMRDYQNEILLRNGYSAEQGCAGAALCPALSLPDLFRTPELSATREQVRALLDAVPPYLSQAAISADRKTAVLAFGLRLQSLEGQREVIEGMRSRLDPPEGVRATLAGLPVLAADANHAMSDPLRRLLLVVAGLLAVALALFAVYRSWARAWVPLVPIALATGWSALVLFVAGVPLNPLSAALSALVIAISTEFSVLLSARYVDERRAGLDPAEALRRTYRVTGAAVLASGVTAIAGFAVLIASDVAMLRDFGLVTVLNLAVSLVGVLAVLPAVLVLAERGELLPRRRVRRRRRRAVAA
ncbi:MMPL family transporter [Solirubrobacter sp. CPCC 204708]|uniref:MMPL family transporter n=1 Tax=Solirubrobacter deserti TaxID=2282478 RepID=A0ABT4RG25_9ACTN|nr:MMPL family transporter [Solirubrobacter deserti]MBE2318225.1 MMPL family transporter [Solirubrobacter deserti]MDA0137506.1 MMPL family transporter [Solirubrobacter deserti]